jgi:hypothetical protein
MSYCPYRPNCPVSVLQSFIAASLLKPTPRRGRNFWRDQNLIEPSPGTFELQAALFARGQLLAVICIGAELFRKLCIFVQVPALLRCHQSRAA